MSFQAKLDIDDGTATVRLIGDLDSRAAADFHDVITSIVGKDVRRLVLLAGELAYLSSAGLRCLLFAHQKLGRDAEIVLVGAQPEVAETLRLTGFDRAVVRQGPTES